MYTIKRIYIEYEQTDNICANPCPILCIELNEMAGKFTSNFKKFFKINYHKNIYGKQGIYFEEELVYYIHAQHYNSNKDRNLSEYDVTRLFDKASISNDSNPKSHIILNLIDQSDDSTNRYQIYAYKN